MVDSRENCKFDLEVKRLTQPELLLISSIVIGTEDRIGKILFLWWHRKEKFGIYILYLKKKNNNNNNNK